MRSIQPSPYGSRFTASGASLSASFTATTRPATGAKRSETLLFDSTTPNVCPVVRTVPGGGSSTNTTSPSASCAKSVMPTTPSPPPTATPPGPRGPQPLVLPGVVQTVRQLHATLLSPRGGKTDARRRAPAGVDRGS